MPDEIPLNNQWIGEQDNIRFLQTHGITPTWMATRALIRTIGTAEGTYRSGQNPYATTFGFGEVNSFDRHPDSCRRITGWSEWAGNCSTAAGIGQYITTTWETYRRLPGFWFNDGEFSPRNQDLVIIRHLGATGLLRRYLHLIKLNHERTAIVVDQRKEFDAIVDDMARIWASFPCLTGTDYRKRPCTGTSFYGQGGKTADQIWSFLQAELKKENDGLWLRQKADQRE